jgi:glycosyltransferase involved in cell wall biosynthesis
MVCLVVFFNYRHNFHLDMTYKIDIYCPDNHIMYDIHTLEKKGVGGGITSRVRIAHALARRGHQVTLFVNCPEQRVIDGVLYQHYSKFNGSKADVFIASSSGGNVDLGDLSRYTIKVGCKILMIHGMVTPKNVSFEDFNFLYVLSNFIRDAVVHQQAIPPGQLFVSYRGVQEEYFKENIRRNQDPHRLVYIGHPEKGLNASISVLRILRKTDQNFNLHVYGGHEMWGQPKQNIPPEPGLIDHGLVGQQRLIREIYNMSFSVNLQAIQEGFGLAVNESMRAGCIVLASEVGAYPEIIQHGYNGFIIPGNHNDPETHEHAARLINQLITHPDYMEYVRRNAVNSPFSWETIARTWEGHWDWHFGKGIPGSSSFNETIGACELCSGALLMLADGLHCIQCGHYQKSYRQ